MAKKVKLIQGVTHWANGSIFHRDVEKEVSDEVFEYLKKSYPNRFEFLEDEEEKEEKEAPKKKAPTRKRKTKNDEKEDEKDEENKEESGE